MQVILNLNCSTNSHSFQQEQDESLKSQQDESSKSQESEKKSRHQNESLRISRRLEIKIIFTQNDFSAMIWVQDDEDEIKNHEIKSSKTCRLEKIDWEKCLISIFNFKWIFCICLLMR